MDKAQAYREAHEGAFYFIKVKRTLLIQWILKKWNN
jgi:hypothetical protein